MRPLVPNAVRRPRIDASVLAFRTGKVRDVKRGSFARALLAPLLAACTGVLRALRDSRAREADRVIRRYAHLVHEAESRNARENAVSPSRLDADAGRLSRRSRSAIADRAVAHHR